MDERRRRLLVRALKRRADLRLGHLRRVDHRRRRRPLQDIAALRVPLQHHGVYLLQRVVLLVARLALTQIVDHRLDVLQVIVREYLLEGELVCIFALEDLANLPVEGLLVVFVQFGLDLEDYALEAFFVEPRQRARGRGYTHRHRSALVGQDAQLAEVVSCLQVAHPDVALLVFILVVFEDLDRALQYYIKRLRLFSFANHEIILSEDNLLDVIGELELEEHIEDT